MTLDVRTLRVQARIACDYGDCRAAMRAPARPPSLDLAERDITGLYRAADLLGWDLTELGEHYCPRHHRQ